MNPAAPFLQFNFIEPTNGVAPCRFLNPTEVISARSIEEVLPALRRVQEAVDGGCYAAGFIAYEAAPAFDSAMAVHPETPLPLVWFGIYADASPLDEYIGGVPPIPLLDWISVTPDTQFADKISSIRESIGAGDVYQVNLTQRLRAPFAGDPFAWYQQLRNAQGAAFSAYLDLGRFHILSLSPELFFRVEPDPSDTSSRTITTRPMKGTHPRGRWTEEDLSFQERLRSCEKERAENLMIVDLLRNDLGKISETGTVTVDEFFSIETYSTLLQMTSTISARLNAGAGLPEIMTALFPCGSVTGAPKIAAMGQIAELEAEPRGIYCGAIGYLEPNGRSVFSVAIRSAIHYKDTDVVEYGVGSGITYDSQLDAEIAENRIKCEFLKSDAPRPDLFETMRLDNGVFSRTDRHIARLVASAAYFGIPVTSDRLSSALSNLAHNRPKGLWRTRLRWTADGNISTESEPLEEEFHPVRPFALSVDPVDRNDRTLFHKIADRSRNALRKSAYPDVYDVLLQNRQGELTEFTTGNLVLEIGGARVTPPLDCGLLPGVLRAELLETGEISEQTVREDDLDRAERVWLINCLRGWVEMKR